MPKQLDSCDQKSCPTKLSINENKSTERFRIISKFKWSSSWYYSYNYCFIGNTWLADHEVRKGLGKPISFTESKADECINELKLYYRDRDFYKTLIKDKKVGL